MSLADIYAGAAALSGKARDRTAPAVYRGQVSGEKMVIITLTDTKGPVGAFPLTRGQKPNLFKCR
jgi:hypothetical protein